MADIGRIASPMNICEEDLYDTSKTVEKEKLLLRKIQNLRPAAFMVGTIDKVNQRISDLDDELSQYDDKLVIESRQSNKSYDPISGTYVDKTLAKPFTPGKVREEKQVDEFADLYAVRSTTTPEVKPNRNRGHLKQSTKQKSDAPRLVELQQFPGWKAHSYTALPHSLSTTLVLDHVVLAQKDLKRKPFYAKEFKKLIYSKINCGILQDTFWWYFLNKYHPDWECQSKLFSRVAYNFVRLFLQSDHPRFRDVFFMNFGSLLAQSVYSSFCLAFPQSWRQFDDSEFKENLCQLTNEWVSGIRQPPKQFKSWNLAELEPKAMRKEEVMKSIQKNDKDKSSIDRLSPVSSITSTKDSSFSRTASNKTFSTRAQSTRHGGSKRMQVSARSAFKNDSNTSEKNNLSPITENPLADDDNITRNTNTLKKTSCAASNPVSFSRNVFNIHGRSPLLAEFFRKYSLDNNAGVDVLVRHTLIEEFPKDPFTFQDVIADSKKQVKIVSKDYRRSHNAYVKSKSEFDTNQRKENAEFWKDTDEVKFVGANAALQTALAAEATN